MRCIVCKQKIIKKWKHKKYCSRKCRDKAYYLNHKQQRIKAVKMWQENNPERVLNICKKANKKYRTEKKEQFNASVMRNYQRNKNKWNARAKAQYQIVVNPNQKCEFCGSIGKIQRHHPDYNFSDKIIFLCEKCHKKHHKQQRQKSIDETTQKIDGKI